MSNVLLYDRKKKTVVEEKVFEEGRMNFLYKTPFGRFLTYAVVKRKIFSRAYSHFEKTNKSRMKIGQFIANYDIDTSEIRKPIEDFGNFNDFFIRELKEGARPVCSEKGVLISPADSKLTAYRLKSDFVIPVKGIEYSVEELVRDDGIAGSFQDGVCLVFRLAVYDYHRFSYIDDGFQEGIIPINGCFHSVSPISLEEKIKVFQENYREYCVLNTENFGKVIHIDVGALLVGKIKQKHPHGAVFHRGEEKGYFEFGGSTIILLFKENTISIDEDILLNSKKGIETIVKQGEKIGAKIRAV